MTTATEAQPARIKTPARSGGTVYSDTVVFSAPEAFAKDVPYQLAMVDLDEGGRLTVRIAGDNVSIGDRVEFLEYRGGIPFFGKPA